MFNWLRRWQKKRQRQIFSFWDGRRNRSVDPLVVWRSFQDDPEFVIDRHPARIDAGEADAQNPELNSLVQQLSREAQAVTAAAVRRAFSLATFESGGLTESECLGLFLDFMGYFASLKKSTSQSAISPSPTESMPQPSLQIQEYRTKDGQTAAAATEDAIMQVSTTKPTSPCGC